ncbi:hypothetical protein B5M43_003780 [Microbacterium sp. MEC084]|uniref:hypothetical protein n=1 Tax=Microbacterium sp. MEC084 TaxID=1963027 RepID=UPI001070137D|nr:hypothetical protein [Microbacterium sp. MEC084]MCD1267969.1 hypothetical protein [Microbacterium sp. MEC084]
MAHIPGYDLAARACDLLAQTQAEIDAAAAALAAGRDATAWRSEAAGRFHEAAEEHRVRAVALAERCAHAASALRWQGMVHAGGAGQEA